MKKARTFPESEMASSSHFEELSAVKPPSEGTSPTPPKPWATKFGSFSFPLEDSDEGSTSSQNSTADHAPPSQRSPVKDRPSLMPSFVKNALDQQQSRSPAAKRSRSEPDFVSPSKRPFEERSPLLDMFLKRKEKSSSLDSEDESGEQDHNHGHHHGHHLDDGDDRVLDDETEHSTADQVDQPGQQASDAESENEFTPLPGIFSRSQLATDAGRAQNQEMRLMSDSRHFSEDAVITDENQDDEPSFTMNFDLDRCRRMATQSLPADPRVCPPNSLFVFLLTLFSFYFILFLPFF